MNNTSIEYVGIKEFRNNISSFVKKSQKSKKRFVVTSNNLPSFEIKPIKESSIYKASFLKEMKEAIAKSKTGKTYTLDEVLNIISK